MKNFRVCNHDLEDWKELSFTNIIDVVNFIQLRQKEGKWFTYEIEWKTPVTGEYASLFKVENGVKVFENEHFKIPVSFRKIKELK